MKKFLSFVALLLIGVTSFAAVQINVSPSSVDFGSVSIKGKTSVEGTATINVSYSGLQPYCSVYFEDDEMPESGAIFSLEGTKTAGVIYSGDQYTAAEGTGLTLNYYAEAAGTYIGKIRFYSYTDADWTIKSEYVYLTIKLVVTGDAVVAQTTPFERVNTTADLTDGDEVVFVSESSSAVSGPLSGAYLTAITDGVKVADGKADVPAGAQTFVMKKYSGNWQFLYPDDNEKALLLDYKSNSAKGAFATTYEAGATVKSWEVSISNGVATVIRPNEADPAYPIRFNSDRFKPYMSESTGTNIAIYKKAGEAHDIQSKLEVEAISFGDVEQDEPAEVKVNYTAENLTDDIIWAIEGSDEALFDLADEGDRTGGTLTITYKGTATKTGALDAKIAYLTQDAKLDALDGEVAISINLIPATVKLTKITFAGAPATIDQGQSIDMSQYVVYTPDNAAVKDLTWSVDKTYQGEVSAQGVLTAKRVTGNVTITATSVRVPSVSASVTLTITKPTVTDFTLSDSEVTLNVGGTKTLSVTAYVPDYAIEAASFASSNTAVATVNKNGLITAKAIGEAEVTATIGEVVKTCKVHVVAVTVEGISFATADVNVTKGTTLQLTPMVIPAQAATEYTIAYASSNEAVATVSEAGLVSGLSEGEAVITATIDGKQAQITIHVVAPVMFAKVTDASTLAANDTIILATIYAGNGVVAGARNDKKLNALTSDVVVTASEAYAEKACRMVLGKDNGKEGFTLTIVGGKTIAVTSNGNDVVDANTQNCKYWELVADGENGYYVHNLGNTNAYFKYHAGNAAIKPYKANTTGAVYVYAYVRKYVAPVVTGVEAVSSSASVQKVIRNGQLLIIRNGETYTLTGEKR
ncbi:MAG: Ig-like domain-containing protein [Paludibacteraceae bacterium]|nr:Ig-like domain-containing protein [Paludibacteraceae bacterium]